MINIDELRQRVEAAEQRFGLIDDSQQQYSDRLVAMVTAIEQGQAQKQAKIAEHETQIRRLSHENQQLRAMLHSLLLAIEGSGGSQNNSILRQLDAKLAAMIERPPAETDAPDDMALLEGPLMEDVSETVDLGTSPSETQEYGAGPTDAALVDAAPEEEIGAPPTKADAVPASPGVREIIQRMSQKREQEGGIPAAS